ncbi:hypothetical protein [uncultured Thiothrix sp.]|uniref:hypothetical protein n=1 Tax=uncultured Thiothrix sp. TaxID=223185 RepID=UPI0026248209|nr:hypothetical protein [uncultured Thiothrix sp.]
MGSTEERINTISSLLTKQASLPSSILDAQFVQEQLGDSNFGPSDFRSFYFLAISPADIPKWKQRLVPLTEPVSYLEPQAAKAWWVKQTEFSGLKFFEPAPLAGNPNGWIGINQQTGQIYIFTFTM